MCNVKRKSNSNIKITFKGNNTISIQARVNKRNRKSNRIFTIKSNIMNKANCHRKCEGFITSDINKPSAINSNTKSNSAMQSTSNSKECEHG